MKLHFQTNAYHRTIIRRLVVDNKKVDVFSDDIRTVATLGTFGTIDKDDIKRYVKQFERLWIEV